MMYRRGGHYSSDDASSSLASVPATSRSSRRAATATSSTSHNKSKKGGKSNDLRVPFATVIVVVLLLLFVVIGVVSTFRNRHNVTESSSTTKEKTLMRAQGKPAQQLPDTGKVSQRANKDTTTTTSLSRQRKPPRSEDCGMNSTLYWRKIAIDLAELPVQQLLTALEDDPFGVRLFEKDLIDKEVSLGRILTLEELKQLFPCPNQCLLASRIDTASLPGPTAFREGNSWLLFQHLRKAGGTHFCSLAEANLPKKAIPSYYCMPDYRWGNWTCAGCLHHWSNEDMMSRMTTHKIAGNEWDSFAHRFLDMPIVLATSFRKPLDRALSQFRFECVEGRGCKILNITQWWERRKDLYNVYTTTFADSPRYYDKLRTTYLDRDNRELATQRGEMLASALDVVLQLHLVLSMEWLAYAGPQVTAVLGFQDTSGLTKRVRPHISQHERHDHQDTNELGAASINKASWDPKTYLSKEQYVTMSETLALDMVLTDAARRIFLERLVCQEDDSSIAKESV